MCPNCEKIYGGQKGVNILGRIEDDGGFLILRFHSYKTIIYGEDFKVVCGNCGEQVYIHTERREDGADINIGSIGIFRAALIGTFIQTESANNNFATGTVAGTN